MSRYFVWTGAGTHIWDHDKITAYEKIEDALAKPEKKRNLMRVVATSKTNMYAHLVSDGIKLDIQSKTVTKERGEEELAAYLAWCNSSTEVCGAEGEGAIPSASTISEKEDENGKS